MRPSEKLDNISFRTHGTSCWHQKTRLRALTRDGTLSSLSRTSVQSEGMLPGSGVRQLYRQDGALYIWIDRPEFPLVLPVNETSERRNAEGHVEVTGLAAGNIEPGARNIFVGPLREPEILVLRQVDFAQPVQLTRNQEVNALLIPNPRDAIGKENPADRSGPFDFD